MKKNLSFSLLIPFAPFLSCSFEYWFLWFIRLQCVAVGEECGFETWIHVLVDRWFYIHQWKVFDRLHVLLAACCYICRSYCTEKLSWSWEQVRQCVCWSKSFETSNLSSIPQSAKKARARLHSSFQVIGITESQRTICFPEVELNSVGVQINTRRVYYQSWRKYGTKGNMELPYRDEWTGSRWTLLVWLRYGIFINIGLVWFSYNDRRAWFLPICLKDPLFKRAQKNWRCDTFYAPTVIFRIRKSCETCQKLKSETLGFWDCEC